MINELILFEDEKYMSKEYIKLVSYFGNLIKKDKCATIFTNETALYYFLKKPSCSKFYYMWTATPLIIQEKIVKKIYERKPTFILYKSDQDIFYNSDKSLKIVNQFIGNLKGLKLDLDLKIQKIYLTLQKIIHLKFLMKTQ